MPSTRSDRARRIARSLGYRRFRRRWNLIPLLNDCESVAWQLERTALPHVTPASIAWMAVRRVGVGRQFKQSIRSVNAGRIDRRSKRPKFRQVHVNLQDVAAVDAPPSETVPGWMDYNTWLAAYDSRKRGIAEALAVGGKTHEVAQQYGVTEGRISQMRREFAEKIGQRSNREVDQAPARSQSGLGQRSSASPLPGRLSFFVHPPGVVTPQDTSCPQRLLRPAWGRRGLERWRGHVASGLRCLRAAARHGPDASPVVPRASGHAGLLRG